MTDFLETTDFEGHVTIAGVKLEITGKIRIDSLCKLHTCDVKLPNASTKDLFRILDANGKEGEPISTFCLECKFPDGRTLSSNDAWFNRHGLNPDDSFGLKLASAKIRSPLKEYATPVFGLFLRGFRCHSFEITEFTNYRICIGGTLKEEEDHNASTTGLIQLHPINGALDYDDAKKFALYIRSVLSFAQIQNLSSPLIRYIQGNTAIDEWFDQSNSASPELGPFHFINLNPIVTAAAKVYSSLPISLDDFHYLIGWLCATTTYDETRFTNGVTALEFFITRHLDESHQFIMNEARYLLVAKELRNTLKKKTLGLSKDERKKLYPKFAKTASDFNRVSLKDKFDYFIKSENISITDIPDDRVKKLINTRNSIVHTGIAPQHNEIWLEIMLLREIITRIILKLLNYEGAYESFFDGKCTRNFPSCEKIKGS